MQKFILSASLLLLITNAKSQITITLDDMPIIGDKITRYVDTLTTTGPGESGENKVWNFSNAVTHLTQTTDCLNPSSTPNGNQFSGSNLAMTNDASSYLYFNQNSQKQEVLGLAGDLLQNGQNIVVKFNPTLLLHQFPRTYGSNFNDTYEFDVDVDGASFGVNRIRLKHKSFIISETDGHGKLITPIGEYDVIRVKTTDNAIDTVFIRLLPFPPTWTVFQTTNNTTISYSWFAKETKLAAGELTLDSLGNPNRFTYTSIPPFSSSINEDIEQNNVTNSLNLFPNPSNLGETIQITNFSQDSHTIRIIDMKGRVIEKNLNNAKDWVKIETSGFNSGTYIYQFFNQNGVILHSGKFIIK